MKEEKNASLKGTPKEAINPWSDPINAPVENPVNDRDTKEIFPKRVFNKKKFLLIAVPTTLVLLVLVILSLLFGWDSVIFKSSVSGTVINEKNIAVQGAKITIQGKSSQTDDKGFYEVKNLKYGQTDVRVEATDYDTQTNTVTLSRGENKNRNFSLKPVGFAYIEGKFLLSSDKLIPEDIKLKIADKDITVTKDGEFKTENIPLGKTTITVTSEIYRDISIDYELKPGKNLISDLALVPAKNLMLTFKNWISDEPIANVTVNLAEQNLKSDKDGKLQLTDLDANGKFSLSAKAENYLEKKDFEIDLATQTGNVEITMTPAGKVAYTSDRDGTSNIYISNYDGSEEKKLTDSKGISTSPIIIGSNVIFESDRDNIKDAGGYTVYQVYSMSISGGTIKKISNLTGNKYNDLEFMYERTYALSGKILYTFNNNLSNPDPTYKIKLKSKNLDGTNEKTVYEEVSLESSTSKRTSITASTVSPDGKKIVFSTQKCDQNYQNCTNKVYVSNIDGSSRSEIYSSTSQSGISTIAGFSKNNSLVSFYEYTDNNDGEVLYWYNLSTNKLGNVKKQNFDSNNTRISDDGQYIYSIATRDSKSDIYRLKVSSGTTEKITDNGKVGLFFLDGNYVMFQSEKDVMISSLGKTNAKQIKIKTNFGMWTVPGQYYGE